MNSEWLWAQRPVGENWICPKLEGPGHFLRPIWSMKTNSIQLLSLKSVTSLRLEVLELWGQNSFKIQRVLKLKNFIRNVSISFWQFYSRYFLAFIHETLPQKFLVFLIVFATFNIILIISSVKVVFNKTCCCIDKKNSIILKTRTFRKFSERKSSKLKGRDDLRTWPRSAKCPNVTLVSFTQERFDTLP